MTKNVSVEVEYSLDDFDVDDIIDELRRRHLTQSELHELYDFTRKKLKKSAPRGNVVEVHVDSLLDKMKLDFVLEATEKFTLYQLEQKLQ